MTFLYWWWSCRVSLHIRWEHSSMSLMVFFLNVSTPYVWMSGNEVRYLFVLDSNIYMTFAKTDGTIKTHWVPSAARELLIYPNRFSFNNEEMTVFYTDDELVCFIPILDNIIYQIAYNFLIKYMQVFPRYEWVLINVGVCSWWKSGIPTWHLLRLTIPLRPWWA